jgi:hypothetical protein
LTVDSRQEKKEKNPTQRTLRKRREEGREEGREDLGTEELKREKILGISGTGRRSGSKHGESALSTD